MEKYEIFGRIGEGAHGIVLKAKHLQSGDLVALKKVSLKRLEDGIPNQAIREIKALQELNHENVISKQGFVLAFDFLLTDLGELIKDAENPMTLPVIKEYTKQILHGVAYMHANSVMHRDIKPANLLINASGQLKIADLGLARLFFQGEGRPYSHQVATRWYRAPELLYGARYYDEGVDLWAVGCVFGEMLNNSPLFPGENDIEQLVYVFRLLGTPTEKDWPGMKSLPDYSKITFPHYPKVPMEEIVPEAHDYAVELLSRFLCYDSKKRISAEAALIHPFIMSFPLPSSELPIPKPRSQKKPVLLDFDPNIPLEQTLVAPSELR